MWRVTGKEKGPKEAWADLVNMIVNQMEEQAYDTELLTASINEAKKLVAEKEKELIAAEKEAAADSAEAE